MNDVSNDQKKLGCGTTWERILKTSFRTKVR